MNLSWLWRKKPNGLIDRTEALRQGAARLEAGTYVSDAEAEADLAFLMALKEDNRNIAEMTRTPGWAEYEAALTQLAMTRLRKLARNHRLKDPEADWDAHLIDIINAVLLGTVNNAIYESANLERLINNKLTAKQRLEENERNG